MYWLFAVFGLSAYVHIVVLVHASRQVQVGCEPVQAYLLCWPFTNCNFNQEDNSKQTKRFGA